MLVRSLHIYTPLFFLAGLVILIIRGLPPLLWPTRWLGAELLETELACLAEPEVARAANSPSPPRPAWQQEQIFSNTRVYYLTAWVLSAAAPMLISAWLVNGPLYDYVGWSFRAEEVGAWMMGLGVVPALAVAGLGVLMSYTWRSRIRQRFIESSILKDLLWGIASAEPDATDARGQMQASRGSSRTQSLSAEILRASRQLLKLAPETRVDFVGRLLLLWLIPLSTASIGAMAFPGDLYPVNYGPGFWEMWLCFFLPSLPALFAPLLTVRAGRRLEFVEYLRSAAD